MNNDNDNDNETETEVTIELTYERREALKLIGIKIEEARKLLEECKEIADRNQVSFSFYGVGNMNNHYIPTGGGVDEYGEVNTADYYDGWENSSC